MKTESEREPAKTPALRIRDGLSCKMNKHNLSSHQLFISYMIAEIMLQKMASEGNHVAENTVQGVKKESNKNLYAIINS
ncbi:hypothetical protein CUMW_215210 [Citrus unshiu]|uniref:Uncharacterized protein n=2 Tax=Citrus unshiu TaxID=55188 RepID=A0A2H5QBU4_CITUN|nr:hypothetical protein CUMW_215210 [Citrus unshiu]